MHFVVEGTIDLLWMLILCSLMKAISDLFHLKGLHDCKLMKYTTWPLESHVICPITKLLQQFFLNGRLENQAVFLNRKVGLQVFLIKGTKNLHVSKQLYLCMRHR